MNAFFGVYFSTRYNESARSDTIDEPLGSAAVRCNEKDKKEKVPSFAILGQQAKCNLLLMTLAKLLRGVDRVGIRVLPRGIEMPLLLLNQIDSSYGLAGTCSFFNRASSLLYRGGLVGG